MLTPSVNFKSKFFDRSISMSSDFLERGPKRVFQGDTSLAAVNLHRSLNNRRFRDQFLTMAKLHSITSWAWASKEGGSNANLHRQKTRSPQVVTPTSFGAAPRPLVIASPRIAPGSRNFKLAASATATIPVIHCLGADFTRPIQPSRTSPR